MKNKLRAIAIVFVWFLGFVLVTTLAIMIWVLVELAKCGGC